MLWLVFQFQICFFFVFYPIFIKQKKIFKDSNHQIMSYNRLLIDNDLTNFCMIFKLEKLILVGSTHIINML